MLEHDTEKWHPLLLKSISRLGDDDFFQSLSTEFQEIVHLDKGNLIIACSPQSSPGGVDVKSHIDPYLSGLYLLDPFYQASVTGLKSGFYTLDDVAPDNFRETEFFLRYYRNAGIADDMGYCFRVGEAG